MTENNVMTQSEQPTLTATAQNPGVRWLMWREQNRKNNNNTNRPKSGLQESPAKKNLYRANGRGGFGSQTAADPLW